MLIKCNKEHVQEIKSVHPKKINVPLFRHQLLPLHDTYGEGKTQL